MRGNNKKTFQMLNACLKIDNFKDVILNQCVRLTKTLEFLSKSRPIDEVKLSTIGVFSILGNLRSVNYF